MKLHVPIKLRWSDLDAYGHVNNAAMLTLLEESRISVFWHGELTVEGVADTAAPVDGGPGGDTLTLIARQEVEYLAPIPYMRQPIDIEMWIGHIGGASAEICYELFSPVGVSPRILYTRATTTIVMVTLATGRPTRISDELRDAWSPYIEEPPSFTKRT